MPAGPVEQLGIGGVRAGMKQYNSPPRRGRKKGSRKVKGRKKK